MLDEAAVRGLPLKARREIGQTLAAASPGPDLRLEVRCPECGADMSYPLDLERFFFEEWSTSLERLYEEVHYLAFHYHWSESGILEMPRPKRRRYLTLLAETLEKRRGEGDEG